MGNLSDRLTNPMQLGDQVNAITEALLLDEQTPGGGGIGGSVNSGYMPIAVSANTLGNGPISQGIDALGVHISGTDSNGIFIDASTDEYAPADGPINVIAGAGLTLENDSSATETGIQIINNAIQGTKITDTGGGGITIFDNQAGGGPGVLLKGSSGMHLSTSQDDTGVTDGPINIVAGSTLNLGTDPTTSPSTAQISIFNSGGGGTRIADGGGGIVIDPLNVSPLFSPGNLLYTGLLVPGTIYSAAGTPLPPAAVGLTGARAFVSDATANVYGTAYASGGAIAAPVYCDGTAWNMG